MIAARIAKHAPPNRTNEPLGLHLRLDGSSKGSSMGSYRPLASWIITYCTYISATIITYLTYSLITHVSVCTLASYPGPSQEGPGYEATCTQALWGRRKKSPVYTACACA